MAEKPVIMVQIANYEWTMEALHCACLLARQMAARLVLVEPILVPYPSLLGTEWGYMNITRQDRVHLENYQATLEDYHVEFRHLPFQCVSLTGATIQIAEALDARVIFARLPRSIFPFWTKFQRRLIERQFACQKRQWIIYPVYDVEVIEYLGETVLEDNHFAQHRSF